jgi:hypothetical protein
MQRIYHRYELHEDWRAGFYWNESGLNKQELKQKCKEFFCDKKMVSKYMEAVIKQWPYSSQHNLSNESMNRVAWLGQAAVCLWCKCPSPITMETWREVPIECRNEADRIAEEIIKKYESTPIQLCLKL